MPLKEMTVVLAAKKWDFPEERTGHLMNRLSPLGGCIGPSNPFCHCALIWSVPFQPRGESLMKLLHSSGGEGSKLIPGPFEPRRKTRP